MTSWRVMLNKKLWKQDNYEAKWKDPETRRLAQSKGAGRMVKCPKKGDRVAFVYAGVIVMVGFIDEDGFVSGQNHQRHSCNDGEKRPHAEMNEFTWIDIKRVGLSQPIRTTGQRTWATLPIELNEWLNTQLTA